MKNVRKIDQMDQRILAHLVTNGRVSWADLAALVELSPPAVAERVRRLETDGVVRGYTTLVDPLAVGSEVLAFAHVTVSDPSSHAAIRAWAVDAHEVEELHVVAGDFDYLLKIRCTSTEALGTLLRDQLRALPGISRTSTAITVATHKEGPVSIPRLESTRPAD